MTRPSTLRSATFPVLLSAAICTLVTIPVAGASSGKAASRLSAAAVTRAFKSQGLVLYDTGFDQPNPVKALASVSPHDGWRVGVFIYGSEKLAQASFAATSTSWLASGMAAARLKNIVVTVVPNGRSLTKKAKPWPMPKLVATALARLTKP